MNPALPNRSNPVQPATASYDIIDLAALQRHFEQLHYTSDIPIPKDATPFEAHFNIQFGGPDVVCTVILRSPSTLVVYPACATGLVRAHLKEIGVLHTVPCIGNPYTN